MRWPTLLLIALNCTLVVGWALHASRLYKQLDGSRRCPVTGLLTRRPFMRAAARILRRKDPVVMFIDLDNFKAVNDSSSHETGDAVLRAVAARLREHLGPDAVVGRLHGDEFAVATGMTAEALRESLPALLARIAEPIETGPGSGGEPSAQRVTVSLGAVYAGALRRPDLSAVLNKADLLMYAAKRAGRHGAEMYLASAGDISLERAVRHRARPSGRSGSRAAWRSRGERQTAELGRSAEEQER